MSSTPGKLRIMLANLAWLLSCIPGWLAFLFASRSVRRAQSRVLKRIIKSNRGTDIGREHQFDAIATPEDFRKVPLSEYEDYLGAIAAIKGERRGVLTNEPVELLHPTSGSIAATKLIPYTRSLRQEFKAAIDPWIASMYLAVPSLLMGRHYWSISPSTPPPADPAAKVRIGFADDSEYLGVIQRIMARALFAAPAEIARVTNQDAFEYLTLLFLCREKNLRLISVWHPSFLTVLLRALPERLPSLVHDIECGTINADIQVDAEVRCKLSAHLSPHPARAGALSKIDATAPDWPQAIWPRLRVISCWTDGVSQPWASEIAAAFPRACIQGKGLTATEGIVTFPLGRSGKKVCAIRSHFLEFIDPATGAMHNAWDVEAGKEYSVALTTGGGLYRYRLHDLVRVTGFYNQAPCLEFLSRDNLVSDMVGEKLSARHVEDCIHRAAKVLDCDYEFAMLAPHQDGDRVGYVLYVEPGGGQEPDYARMASLMEEGLQRNYHYHHARNLSQLEPLRIFKISKEAATIYRNCLIRKGIKAGDIKFQMLSTDRSWIDKFPGEFVASM